MATNAKSSLVEIKPLDIRRVKVRVVGDTPLITHVWSEKSRKQIRDKELKIQEKGRPQRKPIRETIDSIYWVKGRPLNEEIQLCDDKYLKLCKEGNSDNVLEQIDFPKLFDREYVIGFPAIALKEAAATTSYRREWTKDKISVLSSFYVEGYDEDAEIESMLLDKRYIRIKANKPVIREDNVVVGISSADLRYRPQFNNWHADIVIAYDANGKYTIDNIINFLNTAGFTCGIGEWRPEKSGDFGMFHIEGIK